MTVNLERDKGQCPLCLKAKEKLLFVVKSEVYNGRACAEHLHSLLPEAKKPENGTVENG